MTRLEWNASGKRLYTAGVDRGVLYPSSGPGVPWNGLIAVEENSSGGESEGYYYDGVKYLHFVASDEFEGTLEAYMYPSQFQPSDGRATLAPGLYAGNQGRTRFGLTWRNLLGDDVQGIERGYELHLLYNAVAEPSDKRAQTMGQNVDPQNFKWTLNATPPGATTYKPTAHFVINSTEVSAAGLANLEDRLYGSSTLAPSLPTQATVISLLS